MRTLIARLAAALAISLASTAASAITLDHGGESANDIAARGIAYAEGEIAKIATRVANSQRFFYENQGTIDVEARYDVAEGVLILDPGERFGPMSGYAEVEDLQSMVDNAVKPIAEFLPNYVRIEWRYGGHDLYHWFPSERRASFSTKSSSEATKNGLSVLVSAGHRYPSPPE